MRSRRITKRVSRKRTRRTKRVSRKRTRRSKKRSRRSRRKTQKVGGDTMLTLCNKFPMKVCDVHKFCEWSTPSGKIFREKRGNCIAKDNGGPRQIDPL